MEPSSRIHPVSIVTECLKSTGGTETQRHRGHRNFLDTAEIYGPFKNEIL